MKHPLIRAAVACALASTCFSESDALAQSAVYWRQNMVPTPGRSLAGTDDSSTLAFNPANLAFLPGADLRWMWVRTGDDAKDSGRGHSFSFATPLFFNLATGLRFDAVRPPSGADPLYRDPYSWLTWGLAAGSKSVSIGASIAHVYSDNALVGGITGLSVGWTGRPSNYLSLSAVAHDVNAPGKSTSAHLDRSYSFGGTLRPLGSRAFELGVETRYYQVRDRWVPRGVIGVNVPYVGRLRGDVSVSKAQYSDKHEYVATATLDIVASQMQLTGGGIFGSALGSGGAGFVTGLAITSWREPGIPTAGYAVKIRINSTPSNRKHVALLRRLWRIAADPEVNAVVLQLKDEPASSFSHAYELADAIRVLQANGKKVVCAMESEGGRALYVCSHANRSVINPAGGIRFAGLRSERTYLAGLLNKLGVRAEFVRIGQYKSAPEQFTNESASAPAYEVTKQNLEEVEAELINDIARARKLDPAALRAAVANGPFTAIELMRARLVDGFAFDDELKAVTSEVLGKTVELDDDYDPVVNQAFGTRNRVAVVYLEGEMIDGKSRTVPLLDMKLAGSQTIAKAFRRAREDTSVKAVVFRIESGGGSSMAADVMWREVVLTAKVKPVIVSMGTVAASGGYYVAAPATQIFASPYTTTGSIGIFYGKADISGMLGKVGIRVQTIRTAPHADAESMFRPFTPEERVLLGDKVKQFYEVFIDRVSKGRRMTPAQVDAVARGRVWMGRAAMANHLVDKMGGMREALAQARALAELPDDAPVLELPPPETSLLDLVASVAGADEQPSATTLPPQMVPVLRSLAPFLIYEPDRPLALLEVTDLP